MLRKTDLEKFKLELTAYRAAEQTQAERKRAAAPGSPSAAAWEEDEQRERLMKVRGCRLTTCFVHFRTAFQRCHEAIQRFPAIMEVCHPRIYPRMCRNVYTLFASSLDVAGW